METFPLEKQEIIRLYKIADEPNKTWLEKKFGKDFFSISDDWMELWNNFCKENNLTVRLPFENPATREEESTNAHHMLLHIVPIRRGKWEPDFNNSNQYKWEPRLRPTPSGSGFAYVHAVHWNSNTTVGSRLCYPTSELCENTVREFLPIYIKHLIPQTK